MQVVLVGLFTLGVVERDPKVMLNTGVSLAITFAPAALERNYRLHLDPFLSVWIAAAVFFHTIGSAGFYTYVGWWDHLTHALSASLVAAVGYVLVRAIDLHIEEINLPRRVMFVYILVFVLAIGVVWELFEFALDLFAEATGVMPPLSQFGLEDTVNDLLFNAFGAVLVAAAGQLYLTDTAELVRRRLLEAG
ncbi:MAG: hypothetical protein ACLFM8_09300 [Halobacteriales archaeon]